MEYIINGVDVIHKSMNSVMDGSMAIGEVAHLIYPLFNLINNVSLNNTDDLNKFIGDILTSHSFINIIINRKVEEFFIYISCFVLKNTTQEYIKLCNAIITNVIQIIIIIYPLIKRELKEIDGFNKGFLQTNAKRESSQIPQSVELKIKENVNKLCELLQIIRDLLSQIDILAPPDPNTTVVLNEQSFQHIAELIRDSTQTRTNLTFVHSSPQYILTPVEIIDLIIGFFKYHLIHSIHIIYSALAVITVIYNNHNISSDSSIYTKDSPERQPDPDSTKDSEKRQPDLTSAPQTEPTITSLNPQNYIFNWFRNGGTALNKRRRNIWGTKKMRVRCSSRRKNANRRILRHLTMRLNH
jgi:hypothetical protein